MGKHLRARELMVTEALRCRSSLALVMRRLPLAGIAIAVCSLPRRLGVSPWTGEAEDPVLRHARRPRRLLHGGRWSGAVV